MSHATSQAPGRPAAAAGFRILHHPPVCPDCGSPDVMTEEIETGDGITETAHVCHPCGTAWPVACVCEWRATVPVLPDAVARR
jgi:transposase-like protein